LVIPGAVERVRRELAGADGGNRRMIDILGCSRMGCPRSSRPVLRLCRRAAPPTSPLSSTGSAAGFSLSAAITMEAAFCIDALEEALARQGTPDIFNTDQASQFTSATFI